MTSDFLLDSITRRAREAELHDVAEPAKAGCPGSVMASVLAKKVTS